MPCLTLTKPRVRRFWSLEAAACDALLDALVEARFLAKRGTTRTVLAPAPSTDTTEMVGKKGLSF